MTYYDHKDIKNIELVESWWFACKWILIAGLVLSHCGCVSDRVVQKELKLCPQYFQDNVGEAKILPIWSAVVPIMGGPVGWLNKDGSYTLTALASKKIRLHEAFHSFDFNVHRRHKVSHDAFIRNWGGVPKPQIVIYLAAAAFPVVDKIPIPGHVSLYGLSNGVEDTAQTFSFWIRGKTRNDKELTRKCKVIEKFTKGHFITHPGIPIVINETEIQPGIFEGEFACWVE